MLRVIKPTTKPIQNVLQDGQEIGEIVFTGNICCRGYYKDPAATSALFADGVLHTGDLAVWHPDGAIQIMDRAKDLIISGGENVSSLALEGMIVHHPEVLECGVVAAADEKFGERPVAFVTSRKVGLKGGDVIDWARRMESSVSGFMVCLGHFLLLARYFLFVVFVLTDGGWWTARVGTERGGGGQGIAKN
jgi:acyl-CoA synthetase (AMP-forming)/AMP-acid ligase II